MTDSSGSAGAKASRSAGLLTVDLGVVLKEAWRARCDASGARPGPAIAGLVEEALRARDAALAGGQAGASELPARTRRVRVGSRPDEGKKVSREVALTPSEDRAVQAAAASLRLGYQAWVVAAIRGALANAPTYGQAELEAFTASSELLAGLVVDLAKWRREIPETALADRLEALETAVKAHVEAACKVLAQGTRRWEIRV